MNHGDLAFGIVVDQFLLTQPEDQVGSVGRIEDRLERVGLLQPLDLVRDGQQMQVMITQNGDTRTAQVSREAQCFQRLWAAVDQVASQPQAVA